MFNTTNLVQHLQKHSDKFKKHEKEKDDNAIKQPQALKQFTVEQTEDRAQPWSINDLCAQRVTILMSNLPLSRNGSLRFSVVEDSGFVKLLKEIEPCYTIPNHKYITETILP